MNELDNHQQSDAFNELEKLILQYTDEITQKVKVSEDVIEGLKKHLTEQEMVELSLMIGIANMTNRFAESFKPEFL